MDTLTMFKDEVAKCGDEKMEDQERRAAYAYFLRGWHLGKTGKGLTPAWISVTDLLPEAEVFVLAFFVNDHGKHRRIRAFYAPRFTVTTGCDNDWYESKPEEENDDEYYLPEGWYEANEYEETNWHVNDTVTHWMPLPAPPLAESV
jgi:hypothetical protein